MSFIHVSVFLVLCHTGNNAQLSSLFLLSSAVTNKDARFGRRPGPASPSQIEFPVCLRAEPRTSGSWKGKMGLPPHLLLLL